MASSSILLNRPIAGGKSKIEGLPLKNIAVSAADQSIQGELLITQYGLEGGALYQLASKLRGMEVPILSIDLKPSFTAEELAKKINSSSKDLTGDAIRRWRLGAAAAALLRSSACKLRIIHPLSLALLAKNLVIPLSGPRPIAEAISSAGGVSFSSLNEELMIQSLPGLFIAGEMLDWEAPTGGYLLQGCLSTGRRAGQGVLQHLSA
jgi:predicted flavoprotein YhiN